MTDSNFLRRSKAGPNGSNAPALSSVQTRLVLLLLVGAASLLTLAAALTLTSRGPFGHGQQHVSFIERTVGQPTAHPKHRSIVKRYASSNTRVTLHRNGATIQHNGNTVQLAAAGTGSTPWQPRADGALRRTPFGSEAFVTTGTRTENFLNVKSRVGVRTWRWHLGDTAAQLGDRGTVELAGGMKIRRPAIFDDNGKDVTPAGAQWKLAGSNGGTDLLLHLDDANLPVPYVIDPEVDYGSGSAGTLYLTNTLSKYSLGTTAVSPGVTDAFTTTAPGATLCTATTVGTCPGVRDSVSQTTANANFFMPFVGNRPAAAGSFVAAASIVKPTTGNPFGFIVENGGQSTSAGTVIPAANWVFTVPTLTSTSSATSQLYLSVGAWIVTDNGTTPTNGTTIPTIGTMIIDPTATVQATNLAAAATARTVSNTITVAMGKQTLTSQQHILVAFYAVKKNNAAARLNGYAYLGVNGSGTLGATAVGAANLAFLKTPLEAPQAPTSLTAGQVGGYVTTTTPTLSATYVTPGAAATDQGRVDFFLCPTNADCTASGSTWTGPSSSAALTNAGAGSVTVPAATLVDGSTYYLEARNQATDPAAANAPYATTILSPATTLQSLRVDATLPTVAATTPASGAFYGGTTAYPTAWSGTQTDGGVNPSGVASVQVTLADPTGKYWNGASWVAQAEALSWQTTTLGAGTWTWTSPAAAVNGTYTVHVRATDNAGNVRTNATYTFVYDNVVPNVLTATTPAANGFYGNTTAYPTAWAGTASDATTQVSTVQVTLADPTGKYWNGASWVVQAEAVSWQTTGFAAPNWTWTSPAVSVNGTYTVHVRATDQAGNTATNATYTFVYDNVVPNTLTIATPVSSAYYGGTTAYPTAWTGTAGDATAGIPNAAAVQITLQDPAGLYWNGASWQAGAITVAASSFAAGTWNWTSPAVSANGTYNVTVKATDAAGNFTTSSRTFVYDNSVPNTLTIATPTSNGFYGNTAAYPTAWTGTAGDATSGIPNAAAVQITLQDPAGSYWNGASWQAGAITVAASSLAAGTWNWTSPAVTVNGVYNVTVKATDNAGNFATSSRSFTYDNVIPNTLTIATPASNALYGNTTAYPTAWTGTAADATSGFANAAAIQITLQDPAGLYWNGATWQAGATTVAATSLAAGTWNWTSPAITVNGTYNVTVKATDNAGNFATSSRSFTYDNVIPNTLTIATPASNAYYGNTTAYPTAWTGTAADATSGIPNAAAIQITLQNPAGSYWNGATWQA
ncbi:MAG TPA: Ig-like domain-containing protein, partial [Gaiellaceae bacterium]|nr:Ig-like domain-containing protein [Gaiellaceae bacterium]